MSNYLEFGESRESLVAYYQHPLFLTGYLQLPSEFQISSERYLIFKEGAEEFIKLPQLKTHNYLSCLKELNPTEVLWENYFIKVPVKDNSIISTKEISREYEKIQNLLVPFNLDTNILVFIFSYLGSFSFNKKIVTALDEIPLLLSHNRFQQTLQLDLKDHMRRLSVNGERFSVIKFRTINQIWNKHLRAAYTAYDSIWTEF